MLLKDDGQSQCKKGTERGGGGKVSWESTDWLFH